MEVQPVEPGVAPPIFEEVGTSPWMSYNRLISRSTRSLDPLLSVGKMPPMIKKHTSNSLNKVGTKSLGCIQKFQLLTKR